MNKPLLLIVTSALALSACHTNTSNNNAPAAQQGTQSGIDKSLIDASVKPGDDFDKYANGAWEKSAVIPDDKSNISVFSTINDEAQKREAALVDEIVKSNPSDGSDEARIANFYKAYMHTGAIEKRGLSPIKPDLDRIQGIADKGALAEAIGRSLRADADPLNATNFHTENLFGVFVTQGFNDPTKTVPYLLQGGLGLPDRDYYVSADPAMAKLRGDYTPYVAKILTLAGFPNAQARAQIGQHRLTAGEAVERAAAVPGQGALDVGARQPHVIEQETRLIHVSARGRSQGLGQRVCAQQP